MNVQLLGGLVGVGVGAEKSFGQWSIKGEYLVARFDGLSTTTTVGSNTVANTQLVTATTNHLNVSIVRVGLNYQFH